MENEYSASELMKSNNEQIVEFIDEYGKERSLICNSKYSYWPHVITHNRYSIKSKSIPKNGCRYKIYNDHWAISETGDMFNRLCGYNIWDYQLTKDDLIIHLMTKNWFDANTFLPAFREACRRWGISEFTLKINY